MSQINSQSTQAVVMAPLPLVTDPLGGAQPLNSIKLVLENVLERIQGEFDALLQHGPTLSDGDRKRELMMYLHATRQQLLRLVALVHWSPKAKALTECVDHDKVMDKAAGHARVIHATVDDMCAAHVDRVSRFNPMFDVQTALEVLSTGNYRDLPSAIEKLRPDEPLTPAQKKARLRRVSHLIYSQLLKAHLPEGLRVVEVKDGYAMLRAEGLFNAKVTLTPLLEVPDAPSVRRRVAGGPQSATGPARSASPAVAAGLASLGGVDVVDADEEDDVTSGPKPQRWLWLLLGFELLPNRSSRLPLGAAQVAHLLYDLNRRMSLVADAAAYEKQRRVFADAQSAAAERAQEQAGAAGEGDGTKSKPVDAAGGRAQAGGSAAMAAPSASGVTGLSRMSARARSTATAVSATAGGAAQHSSHMEAMREHAADEVTLPLLVAHCVLSEVAMRLLVDAVRGAAEHLASPGGPWMGGHLELQPAKLLMPGLRATYWKFAAPLLPLQAEGHEAMGERALEARAARGQQQQQQSASCYHLEVGVDTRGAPVVRHLPQLQPLTLEPGDDWQGRPTRPQGPQTGPSGASDVADLVAEPPDLVLDSASVNVDEVLLQATGHIAASELLLIRSGLMASLAKYAPAAAAVCSARLVSVRMPWVRRQLGAVVRGVVAAAAVEAAAGPAVVPARKRKEAPGSVDDARGRSVGTGQEVGDEAGTSSSAGDQLLGAQQVTLYCPVLELYAEDMLFMKVSKSLFTGRILLQPGTAISSDMHLTSHQAMFKMEEDLNNRMALDAQSRAAVAASAIAPGSPVAPTRAVRIVWDFLTRGVLERYKGSGLVRFISAARRLQLHNSSGLGRAFVTAHEQEMPWLNLSKLKLEWAFVPVMLPSQFPALSARGPSSALEHSASSSIKARGLYCVLSTSHPSGSLTMGTRPSYSLVVCSCSAQGVPLQVIKNVPIPVKVYALNSQPHRWQPGSASRTASVRQPAPAKHDAPAAEDGVQQAEGAMIMQPGEQMCRAAAADPSTSSHPASHGTANSGPHSLAGTPWLAAAEGMGYLSPSPAPPTPLPDGRTPVLDALLPMLDARTRAALPCAAMGVVEAGPTSRPEEAVCGRDIEAELGCVVAWCRVRIQWELLLCQLQALQVTFIEAASCQPPYTLFLEALPGAPIPHLFTRRQQQQQQPSEAPDGPSHVGVHRVEVGLVSSPAENLQLGGASSGFVARVHGSFFADADAAAAVAAQAAGGPLPPPTPGLPSAASHRERQAALRTMVQAAAGSRQSRRAAAGLPMLPLRGILVEPETHPAASPAQQPPLELRYSFSQGHSAQDMVQDLLALVRMQGLLAQLEGMAVQPRPQRLLVVCHGTAASTSAPGRCNGCSDTEADASALLHSLLGASAVGAVASGVRLEEASDAAASLTPSKRARTDELWLRNGFDVHDAPSSNGFRPERHDLDDHSMRHDSPVLLQHDGISPGPSDGSLEAAAPLSWSWPSNGAVSLQRYGYSAAVLRYRTAHPSADRLDDAPGVASLDLHIQWLPASAEGAKEGRGNSSLSGLPECCKLSCRMQPAACEDLQAAGSGASARRQYTVAASPLPEEVLASFEQMADLGESGILLDALAITTGPMMQLRQLGRERAATGHSASEPAVLVATLPPFQHRVVCHLGAKAGPLPQASPAPPVREPHLSIDVFCTAAGKCWLQLGVAVPGPGPSLGMPAAAAISCNGNGSSSNGSKKGVQVLADVRRCFAGEAPDVVSIGKGGGVAAPESGGGAAAGVTPMWLLVDSGHVGRVLSRIIDLAA